MNEKTLSVIKELKEKSKKRNFPQTFDLIINLKELDLKKPESKINEEIVLPYGKGKESKVVVFSDSLKSKEAIILTSNDLEKLARQKREAKKLAQETDFFLAEAKLMPVVGRILGQSLGPKGKIPKVLSGDVSNLIKNYKKTVRVRIKESPVLQCAIGNEQMKDEEIVENITALLKSLETKLPKGKNNIGNVLLKLTMSKPIKLEV